MFTWEFFLSLQLNCGGHTSELKLSSKNKLSFSEKLFLGLAIKKILQITRNMYIDDGSLVPTALSSRLLQINSTNNVSNSSNTTYNSSNNITYPVSFFIVPDYTLTSDNINAIVNNSLSNPTEFLSNLTIALGNNASQFQITSIIVSEI